MWMPSQKNGLMWMQHNGWPIVDTEGDDKLPVGIAVDHHGNVYVTVNKTYGGASVQVYAPDGSLVDEWGGAPGSAPGQFQRVGGIDVDAALSIAITSAENTVDAVVVEATAGGVQILASNAAATEDILITASGSSVIVTATENQANAITLAA